MRSRRNTSERSSSNSKIERAENPRGCLGGFTDKCSPPLRSVRMDRCGPNHNDRARHRFACLCHILRQIRMDSGNEVRCLLSLSPVFSTSTESTHDLSRRQRSGSHQLRLRSQGQVGGEYKTTALGRTSSAARSAVDAAHPAPHRTSDSCTTVARLDMSSSIDHSAGTGRSNNPAPMKVSVGPGQASRIVFQGPLDVPQAGTTTNRSAIALWVIGQ